MRDKINRLSLNFQGKYDYNASNSVLSVIPMFTKPKIETSLAFFCKITFLQPIDAGSEWGRGNPVTEIGTERFASDLIEVIKNNYQRTRSDAKRAKDSPGAILEIRVTGTLSGKNVNECFGSVQDFDLFMNETGLLASHNHLTQ